MHLATAPGAGSDDVRRVPIRVVRSPHVSVVQWLIGLSMPAAPRSVLPHRFASTAGAASRPALQALALPQLPFLPYIAMNPRLAADTTVREHAEFLRDADGSDVADQINAFWGSAAPPPWRRAAAAPRAWLHSLASACTEAWAVAEPRWRQAAYEFDRESARIGSAVVSGNVELVLNTLHPGLVFRTGTFGFRSCDVVLPVGTKQVVLIPTLAAGTRMWIDPDDPEVLSITYPLRRSVVRPAAGLTELLGPLRATALVRLGRPVTMQQLALLLQCARSTATYHCDQLVSAGLVARDRDGATVRVRRTQRGDELIELFGRT